MKHANLLVEMVAVFQPHGNVMEKMTVETIPTKEISVLIRLALTSRYEDL